jgi:zinc and cadmium transporter
VVDRVAHRASVPRQNVSGVASGRLLLTVASDGLHNLIDGILIATTFLEQPALGVITAGAVALHEVPRELATFALCVAGGLTIRRSLLLTVATAMLAIAGAILVVSLGPVISSLGFALVPFAAGTFLYLAGSIIGDSRAQLVARRVRLEFAVLVALGLVVTLAAS